MYSGTLVGLVTSFSSFSSSKLVVEVILLPRMQNVTALPSSVLKIKQPCTGTALTNKLIPVGTGQASRVN